MNQKYQHVIVVGIDGAGAFIRDAETPNFDRIFADGAKTFDCLSSRPTISAECWGSMLTGVSPKVHGLTNSIVSERPYPEDSPFPSVFRRIRAAMPDAELGSYCDWSPITDGIVEQSLGVSAMSMHDTDLTPHIVSYIRKKKPTFLFIQMDSVDGAGHRYGYGPHAPDYMKRISEVDALVGDVRQAVTDAGIADDTLFCVIADHGGTPGENGGGGSHGGWTDAEKYVTFAAEGKTVRKGEIGPMNVRDLASVVLYALGIEAPDFAEDGWTSQVPADLFDDASIPAYRDISAETGAAPRISRVHHTSELV